MTSTLESTLRNFERKQIVVSALALIILIGLSIVFNYVHLTSQAEQTAQLVSRMMQIEDRREVEITLEEARLNYFKTIKFVSPDPSRAFTLPKISELLPEGSLFKSLSLEHFEVPVSNLGQNEKIIFEFSRFSYVLHAIAIWIILNLVSFPQTRFMKRRIIKQYEKDMAIEKDLAQSEVARKIRHNIRTPLSALMRLSSSNTSLNMEESLLFQNIITQIKGLISELDGKSVSEDQMKSSSIGDILRNSLQEIRVTLPDNIAFENDVDDAIHSAITQFVPHELRSILSNLTTNSLEAMPSGGHLKITAKDNIHEIQISVMDSGVGISPEILPHVTEKAFTYGKSNGSGLGLHHAKESLATWGGDLKIESGVGEGTVVTISLPILEREAWHVPRLRISNTDAIIVIDDQISIHRIWKMRLAEIGFKGQFFAFNNTEESESFIRSIPYQNLQLFVDYDLGVGFQSGIDFLRTMPQLYRTYLVTGNFDLVSIKESCRDLNVGLIPKTELSEVPILLG